MISINLQNNVSEITLRHGCSPVNLVHSLRTPFIKNKSRWLLLTVSVVENEMLKIAGFINSFMTETGLDCFLYDNGFRHERVNITKK